MSDHVTVADAGPVRTVRMNRPDKKNALTAAMYDAMAGALESANSAPDIRCVRDRRRARRVLGRQRSAGVPASRHIRRRTGSVRSCASCMRWRAAERPLVAAVQGVAVGVGTTMLLHCDYVVAGTDARFSTPFVRLGLVPEAASSLMAPRLMGHRRAFALLVMGRPLDAAAAPACGLVNAVVPPGDVDAEAMKAAREIAALPAEAVAASRRLMRGSPDDGRRADRRRGSAVQGATAIGGGASRLRGIPDRKRYAHRA